MDKLQAYNQFWNSFTYKAYNEVSTPSDAILPYITYEGAEDDFGSPVALTASLWDRSASWTNLVAKKKEIESTIGRGGKMVLYDGGAFWIRKGSPWAQRMGDDSDPSVKRIVMNLIVEFID